MTDVVTVDEVMNAAVRETGHDDFGDPAWREGLAMPLDEAVAVVRGAPPP